MKHQLIESRRSIGFTIDEMQDHLETLDHEMKRLKDDRDRKLMEMHQTLRGILERVKIPFKDEENRLSGCMKQLRSIASGAERCICESEEVMLNEECETESGSESAAPMLLAIVQSIDDVQKDLDHLDICDPRIPIFVNEMIPPFEYYKMTVEGFLDLSMEMRNAQKDEKRYIYSDKIRLYGAGWRLKLYPSGNSNGLDTHVSIFIEAQDGIKDEVSIVYQIELFNANHPESSLTRSYTSTFELMDSWGWNKLVSLNDICQYVRSDGTLILQLGLRPETYVEAVRMARSQQKQLDVRLDKHAKESRMKISGAELNSH
jgi:hypothetical protein